jgi:capsular polysaccharide biosynthesis protein
MLRRGWIMLLVALIAAGIAYFLSRQQDPVYRATQNVVIQPSRADLGLAEASVRLLNSLVVIINSEQTAQRIIDDLELDLRSDELKGMATIAADQFRLVIRIDIESENREEAQQIAAAWGNALKDYRDQQNAEARREDRVFAILPDGPTVSQIAPRPIVNGIAAGILGFLVGGVVVFILEYLESSAIRRREDLERALQMDVIATIPGFDPS